jgi:hypothetical protein
VNTPDTPSPLSPIADAFHRRTVQELAALLLRDAGIHSGHYELAVEFTISVGVLGNGIGAPLPAVLSSFAAASLRPCKSDSPLAVDAAVVNPASTKARVVQPRAAKAKP